MNVSMNVLEPKLVEAFGIALAVATVLVHIVFASGVYIEAVKARARGERVLFAPAWIWGLSTLLAGPLMAAAFWFVHFSPRRARAQRDLVDDTGGSP